MHLFIILFLLPISHLLPAATTAGREARAITLVSGQLQAQRGAPPLLPARMLSSAHKVREDMVQGQTECPLCSIEFEDATTPQLVLTCGHKGCFDCMTAMLNRFTNCPICRKDFHLLPIHIQVLSQWYTLTRQAQVYPHQLQCHELPAQNDEKHRAAISAPSCAQSTSAAHAASATAHTVDTTVEKQRAAENNLARLMNAENIDDDVTKLIHDKAALRCKTCRAQAKCPGCKKAFRSRGQGLTTTGATSLELDCCGYKYCFTCVRNNNVLTSKGILGEAILCKVCRQECPAPTRSLLSNFGKMLFYQATATPRLKHVIAPEAFQQHEIYVHQLQLAPDDSFARRHEKHLVCTECYQQSSCANCAKELAYNTAPTKQGIYATLRSPNIVLPCGHSCCITCIARPMTQNISLACGLCMTPVPATDAQALGKFALSCAHLKQHREIRLDEVLAAMVYQEDAKHAASTTATASNAQTSTLRPLQGQNLAKAAAAAAAVAAASPSPVPAPVAPPPVLSTPSQRVVSQADVEQLLIQEVAHMNQEEKEQAVQLRNASAVLPVPAVATPAADRILPPPLPAAPVITQASPTGLCAAAGGIAGLWYMLGRRIPKLRNNNYVTAAACLIVGGLLGKASERLLNQRR